MRRLNGFLWREGDEDSEKNRLAYMDYLRNMLQIPEDYSLADVQPDKQLLSVELFREMTESRKVSGTTDVAIAKSRHVQNNVVRNNIEALLELKAPKNMRQKDHSPQTICEHFAASYLNPNHAVVSVLTDLNATWIFFWYAIGEDDSTMSLYRLVLHGDKAAGEGKYLLDSLHDNSVGETLPTTFAERQPLQAVLDDLIRQKRAQKDLDGDNDHNRNQDSRPSSSGNVERYPPGSNVDSLSERNDISGQQSSPGNTVGGFASMNMAHALTLFAPPADRDVANELDLLDMLDPNEQYKIISSFASKHIVPHMKGKKQVVSLNF